MHPLGEVNLAGITPAMIDTALTDPLVMHTSDGLPKSPATMHRIKAVVKAFFAWTTETGLCESNPARFVTMKRLSRKPPEYLTEPEKKRFLKELHGRDNPLARRDRVIFELFLSTGIRLTELVNLDVDSVDLDKKHIRVMGKGGVPQIKFLKTSMRILLRAYLKERRHPTSISTPALFISLQGRRLSGRQIAQRLSYWRDKAGIVKKVTPHGRRHTFATHLYANGKGLLLVKRALGRRDISTTEIYTHLSDEVLEMEIEQL